jgi:homoserine dehydrogenase
VLTTDVDAFLSSGAELWVEAIGGSDPALRIARHALGAGKRLVTANKALLAVHGPELAALARRSGGRLDFESAVAGGIPVIRSLRDSLGLTGIRSIRGILNGTTNYILSRLGDGWRYADALADAQAKGFAEADPALDIDGDDAAQKLRILAGVGFDAPVRSIRVHGIRDVTLAEVEAARSRRSVVRHVATARRVGGGVELRVERRELPEQHPLAAAKGENNAVLVRGRAVGEMLFAGKGAGSLPTAAAVLSDVIELSEQRAAGRRSGLHEAARCSPQPVRVLT